MKKDMINKHEKEKTDLTKAHEVALSKKGEESKSRIDSLNEEIDKYSLSNEDLFNQND